MYEPSLRSPLIFRYPDGIERKVENEHMVLNVDLAPNYSHVRESLQKELTRLQSGLGVK